MGVVSDQHHLFRHPRIKGIGFRNKPADAGDCTCGGVDSIHRVETWDGVKIRCDMCRVEASQMEIM